MLICVQDMNDFFAIVGSDTDAHLIFQATLQVRDKRGKTKSKCIHMAQRMFIYVRSALKPLREPVENAIAKESAM